MSGVDVYLVSCDPGKAHCGVSLFRNERLFAATVIKLPKMKDIEGPTYRQGKRTMVESSAPTLVSHMAANWLAQFGIGLNGRHVDEFVGEMPQVYQHGKAKKKVDPEDLIFVQSTNQGVALVSGARRVRFITPGEHKGQMDPEAYWDRVEEKLTEEEKHVLRNLKAEFGTGDRSGHGIDSIGVGLWAHWRIG